MRIILAVVIFFIMGGLIIISNDNLAMNQSENFSNFSESYVGWIEQIYFNIQSITGDVVKLSWFPSNK
ncbi:MAG: hypothetical protein WC584_02370 [Candidatus Pacearchaeota archaeon]